MFTFSFDMDDDGKTVLSYEIPSSSGWNTMFLPDLGVWSDSLAEVRRVEEPSTAEWEVVARPARVVERVAEAPRPPRWCMLGNACPRADCRFRHERCGHYDAWIARGKRGHSCRSLETDPRSLRSPTDGGCKYDHRDPRDLTVTPPPLPVKTESQLFESFYALGLDYLIDGSYDISRMRESDYKRLLRSLKAAGMEYEEFEDYINIETAEVGLIVDMSTTLPVKTNNDLIASFGSIGLKLADIPVSMGNFYDISRMSGENRATLWRSLEQQDREAAIDADMKLIYVL